MTELEPSKRRRLISVLPAADGASDFLSDLSSLIVTTGVPGEIATIIARESQSAIDHRPIALTSNLIQVNIGTR